MKAVALAMLVASALSCHRPLEPTGTRIVPYRAARLVSEYRRDPESGRRFALLHVLFMPPFEPGRGEAFGGSNVVGGSSDRTLLRYSYTDVRAAIESMPVTVSDNRMVAAGGRLYDLERGNVFIANVSRDGTIDLAQIHVTREDENESADSVLAAIRAAVPRDARVADLTPPARP